MTRVVVPDLGDFKDVEVIDVLVKPGDTVQLETPLITLETEKATMDVPSSAAGVVKSVAVKKGDRVSKGSATSSGRAKSAAAEQRNSPRRCHSSIAWRLPASPNAETQRSEPAAATSSALRSRSCSAPAPAATAAFRAADLA